MPQEGKGSTRQTIWKQLNPIVVLFRRSVSPRRAFFDLETVLSWSGIPTVLKLPPKTSEFPRCESNEKALKRDFGDETISITSMRVATHEGSNVVEPSVDVTITSLFSPQRMAASSKRPPRL